MTEAEQNMVNVAILMCQELQEFVDEAIEASGDPNSLEATQELINDWEAAHKAAGGKGWLQQIAESGDAAELNI